MRSYTVNDRTGIWTLRARFTHGLNPMPGKHFAKNEKLMLAVLLKCLQLSRPR